MYWTLRRETPRRCAAVATFTLRNAPRDSGVPLSRGTAEGPVPPSGRDSGSAAGLADPAASFVTSSVCLPALPGRTPRTEDACACLEDLGARHAVPLRPPMPPPRLPLRLGFAFWPGGVVARPLAGPARFDFLTWPERLAGPPLAGLLIFRLTAPLQEVSCYDCPIPPDAMPLGAPERGGRPHTLAGFGERRSPRRLWRLASPRPGAGRDARAALG